MRYRQAKRRRSSLAIDKKKKSVDNNNDIRDFMVIKDEDDHKNVKNEDIDKDCNNDVNDDNQDMNNDTNVQNDNQEDGEEKEEEEDSKDNVKQSQIDSNSNELKTKIIENDKYFSSLIDLIPAKIYFEGNDQILQEMENNKRSLFGNDTNLSAKAKHKRFRVDPTSGNKTVSEIANNFYNKNKKNKPNDKMSELRHKLNEKIQQLKSKRGQKSNARQLRESKKERKKLNSMRASKQKGFSKKKSLGQQNASESEAEPKKLKSEDTTDANNSQMDHNSNKVPKIYNKEGNLVFSKFDFVSTTEDKKTKPKKKKLEVLLNKTKKEEKKLSELEATNPPKAKEVKEKKMWRNALDKSEGIKVKDKSKLIEKSIKKKKKLKAKSSEKWTQRKETTEKLKNSKQEKRQKNLNRRKEMKKEKKIKILKKKGRYFDNK